jgi:dolichol-phosphate mannosyltransferase
MKKISIIIPLYNEDKNIPLIYQQIKKVLGRINFDYEIIFVNDGSEDNSGKELEKLSLANGQVKIIEFTRNFGKEIAITAGLNFCQGLAAIIIDADFQHPVELIPEFIKKWEQGSEVIIGVRNKSRQRNLFKAFGSWFFYKIINVISETKVVPYSTDYRLLDRRVIDEFNRLTEKNRMARSLIAWLGFKRDYIYFNVTPRINGPAGYSSLKLVRLAFASMVSLSLLPLKLAGYLGIVITFFSGLIGLFILIEKYLLNDLWGMGFSGPAQLAILIIFLVGIILSCLGLISLYIANIHNEVVGRPMYVIRKKENFD